MSWRNYLRLGIIFVASGLITLAYAVLTQSGHLPSWVDVVIGVMLVAIGVPLLVVGIRRRSLSANLT
jgi:sulfite exporter TauE/SafE